MSDTKNTTKKAAQSKKPVAKKAAAKRTTKQINKPGLITPAKVAKRVRESKPLYAEVTLGQIKDIVGKDNDDATIVVSRNFVLDLKKKQLEAEAATSLGI